MRKKDLFRFSVQNLLRHKSRALLTILGVVVGCCSIVIMVSLGLGMQKMQEQALAEMGDLTMISITAGSDGGKTGTKLNDKLVKKLEQIPGVVTVAPKTSLNGLTLKVYAGEDKRYVCDYMNIAGMDEKSVESLDFQLLEGEYPHKNTNEVLVGQYFAYAFADSLRPEGSNIINIWDSFDENGEAGELPKPYIDPLKEEFTVEVYDNNKNAVASMKVKPSGQMKEAYMKAEETYDGIFFTKLQIQELLQQAAQNGLDVKQGREYSTIMVKTESLEQVAEVEKKIQKLGVRTYSMESIREPMKKQAQQKQMMLGGLGAISLLVAAIGIMNTMIMSITERKREIGIMKAVGCFVEDIKALFLLEAGFIGFLGGGIGILISVTASFVMNRISGTALSVIPPWLALFALLFSILIGVGSGYYPANKAVKISALEAMKS